MKPSEINEVYKSVMAAAKTSREHNPRHGIEELLQKPTFSGFVEVSFLKDISVSMFLCENDDGVALRCLWNGPFEPLSMALWSVLAGDSDCMFDVGAYSGIYSLVAYAVNPTAAVVSFEPFPLNFGRLTMNLQANNFPVNLAINAAASDKGGVVPFAVTTPSGYLSSGGTISSQSQTGAFPVNCTSLDDLMANNGLKPKLLKIDVEGHELQVLQGSSRLLEELSPDIIVESAFNQDTGDMEDLLKNRGYGFYVIQEDTLTLEAVDHLRPSSADGIDMDQVNRLVTTRGADEISGILSAARSVLVT